MLSGRLRPLQIDLYLIGLMLPRMGMALVVAMAALLIERLLRLVELMGGGTGVGPVLLMLTNLLPHYLGLALPVAFCIAVLAVLSSLCQSNEIDVMEASGLSIRRIGFSFVLCGGIFGLLSLALFGYVQPYSRYAYRAVQHAALQAGWDGRLEAAIFIEVGDELVLSAEEIDPAGTRLKQVFMLQSDKEREVVTTASQGVVVAEPERRIVRLMLLDGVSMLPDGGKLEFDRLLLKHEFDIDDNPFRVRGSSERELTLGELAERMSGDDGLPAEPRFTAAFHGRIARAVAVVAVALMAVPLAVARKRSPLWPRIAIALIILLVFDHLLKLAESLGELGRIDPALAVWSVCALYFALAIVLYMTTSGRGSSPTLRWLLRRIDDLRLNRVFTIFGWRDDRESPQDVGPKGGERH